MYDYRVYDINGLTDRGPYSQLSLPGPPKPIYREDENQYNAE